MIILSSSEIDTLTLPEGKAQELKEKAAQAKRPPNEAETSVLPEPVEGPESVEASETVEATDNQDTSATDKQKKSNNPLYAGFAVLAAAFAALVIVQRKKGKKDE